MISLLFAFRKAYLLPERSRQPLPDVEKLFFDSDHNFATPWSQQYKKDVGGQFVLRKIRWKPPQSILDGIEPDRSFAIKFGGIFEAPKFRSFSTESVTNTRSTEAGKVH